MILAQTVLEKFYPKPLGAAFPTVFRRNALLKRHVRSFDTKTAPRISREPFDLESPNFTTTSTPAGKVYSHTGFDDIIYFRSEVIAKKTVEHTDSDGFGRNFSRTVFKRGLPNFTHFSRTICLINLLDTTSVAPSSWFKMQLNTAQKCAKRVRPGRVE